jgi:hypothetical protein
LGFVGAGRLLYFDTVDADRSDRDDNDVDFLGVGFVDFPLPMMKEK